MNNSTIVTTSWDDGDPSDMKVAELLRTSGIPGTFYVPMIGYEGRKTLTVSQLRSLASEGFEAGGHTVSHVVLPPLPSEEVAREVRGCKDRLEDIVGARVRMFCYPKGQFNAKVIRHVNEAGYEGARTTRMFGQRADFHRFQMPTSLHAYPNTKVQYTKNLLKAGNARGLLEYGIRFLWRSGWASISKALFDQVLAKGGVWHLYGHSWLIEEMGLWNELKEVLDYVRGRGGVRYLTNAEVLTCLPEGNRAASTHSILDY